MQDFSKTFDIVFVSAFGRHHWLAKELAGSEWGVGHIDVSKLLGQWGDQDIKNPFGLSKVESLNKAQFSSWQAMANAQKVENGLSLLLDRGPFEGSGPLRDFFKSNLDTASNQSFEQNWLENLSKQLASSIYLDNFKAHELTAEVPISDELWSDASSPETRHSRNFFKDVQLVQNFEASRFLSVEKNSAHGFEMNIETPYQGESKSSAFESKKIKTRVLVWALTSAETEYISRESVSILFSSKVIDPTWSWQRFSYSGPREVLERWPIQFYLLEHLRMPWTHDNLCLIAKKSSTQFEVCMRIPTIFRFNSDYHFALGNHLQNKMADRFTSKEFELIDLPIESKVSKEKLGPPRWPVYAQKDQSKPLKHPFLIFESCENLKTHQAQASLKFQQGLYSNLTLLRKQWLAVEAKAQQKAINREINMRK